MRSYVILAVILLTASFSSCTKYPSAQIPGVKPGDSLPSPNGKNVRMASGMDGLSCNCAVSQASCKAECVFSECCICWNPFLETGACACYFGIAKCKTSLIGRDASTAYSHRVLFYPNRFGRMIQHLRQASVSVDSIEAAYRILLRQPDGTSLNFINLEDTMEVSSVAYDRFFLSYHRAVTAYDEPTQQRILTFTRAIQPSSLK